MREKLIELLKLAPPVNNNSEVGENFRNCVLEKFADYLIDEGVTIPKWIPVSERKPTNADADRYGRVLTVEYRMISLVNYLGPINYPDRFPYWMPLPEPPKGES